MENINKTAFEELRDTWIWIDKENNTHKIKDMSEKYITNVIVYLEAHINCLEEQDLLVTLQNLKMELMYRHLSLIDMKILKIIGGN